MMFNAIGGSSSSQVTSAVLSVRGSALWRCVLAEFVGSGFLAAVVVGSGIAAQQLSPGDAGLQLVENAAATALGLFAVISMVGPVSGAHLNPVISVVDAALGRLPWRHAAAYLPAQVAGCGGGVMVANAMFSRAALSISTRHRASGGHLVSETVATFGLLLVVFALARSGRARAAPAAIAAYIGAAYFFTSSTSFANPALTAGRTLSDSFASIAPSSVPAFLAAQAAGAMLAFVVIKVLYPPVPAGPPPQEDFSSWPPNSLRMAESMRSAKSPSPRELKRSISAVVNT